MWIVKTRGHNWSSNAQLKYTKHRILYRIATQIRMYVWLLSVLERLQPMLLIVKVAKKEVIMFTKAVMAL